MALLHRLDTATFTQALLGKLPPKQLPDGGGLYLVIRDGRPPRWLFRYLNGGHQHYVGLGYLRERPAKVAREQAALLRIRIAQGDYPHLDEPVEEAEPQPTAPTAHLLKTAVKEFLEIRPPSKNAAHAAQWEQTTRDYIVAPLGHLAVNTLTCAEVAEALEPLWKTRNETARRTLGRLRRILDREIALSRATTNAATLGPIQAILGNHRSKTRNHNALDYKAVPAFLADLAQDPTLGAQALRFVTLTAARTIEVRTLRFRHIVGRVWSVPEEIMKMDRPHRVPLSKPALAIVDEMRGLTGGAPDDFVFPGSNGDGMLSENTLIAVMARHGLQGKATPHGMRSCFRTWCSKTKPKVQFEIAEECLAHLVGTKTQRAYERPDYFEERTPVMERWARFCLAAKSSQPRQP